MKLFNALSNLFDLFQRKLITSQRQFMQAKPRWLMMLNWALLSSIIISNQSFAIDKTDKTKLVLPIKIFATQNFYGQLAKQIGGQYVEVHNIDNNQADPHHFEISIKERRLLDQADIVIQNGLSYESWLSSHSKQTASHTESNDKQQRIVVADLLDKPNRSNPHIWYDPKTMPALADALTHILSQKAPLHRSFFRLNLHIFNERYQRLNQQIADIKKHYAGSAITATEPLFNDMASAMGLVMQHTRFQEAIMNHTEPSARDAAALEDDLRHKRIKVLIENQQTHTPFSKRFVEIANQASVKVVSIRENMPADQNDYIVWMGKQLNDLKQALGSSSD